jgi:hypothetical protein
VVTFGDKFQDMRLGHPEFLHFQAQTAGFALAVEDAPDNVALLGPDVKQALVALDGKRELGGGEVKEGKTILEDDCSRRVCEKRVDFFG